MNPARPARHIPGMRFHDRHERLDYMKAELAARRIVERPEVIGEACAFIERFWRDDPHSSHALATWEPILALPPFGITTSAQVARLIERMRA